MVVVKRVYTVFWETVEKKTENRFGLLKHLKNTEFRTTHN